MSVRSAHARLLLALLLVVPGCRATDAGVERSTSEAPPVEPAEFGSMRNVSVSGSAWIGSRPGVKDLDLAARRGIVAAIDLACTPNAASRDLESACAVHRIEYVPVGLGFENGGRGEITGGDVERVLGELRRRAGKPHLFFCAHGDRAAMLFAIHRVLDADVPLEQALVDARRAGMKAGRSESFVREQVERLSVARGQGDDASASIASTIEEH